jgi:hypothetical protein
VIDRPFKAGYERSEDDVSLFLLNEFLVQVEASGGIDLRADEVEARAEQVEELLAEAEHQEAMEAAASIEATEGSPPSG